MATLFWHSADWHTNRRGTGLRVPRFVLEEGDNSEISDFQRFLFRSLLNQQKIILQKAKQYKIKKKNIWFGHGGDLGELDTKKRGEKLHTQRQDIVLDMIAETIKPVTDVCSKLFFVNGTDAHVGDIEHLAARDLDGEIHPDTNKPIAPQWLIDLDGVPLMFQHHGKLGRLPWTKANALNQKTSRLLLRYGARCPRIFVQSHNHTYATNDRSMWDRVIVIASPCMTLPNDYSHRIDADDGDVGGLYFICDKGEILEWDVMRYKPREITKWSP